MSSLHSPVAIASGSDSNHHTIKQLITSIQEYSCNRTENSANAINRHLQHLSVTIDMTIFDPHVTIVGQLFASLYELMSKMEQGSSFSWYCVDVLTNACRNSAARYSLIHTYNFLPSLSRLLSDQLTVEKKIRLLRLMQDLSCGMKISWQIPHLPHLMVTLCKWIESQNEDIITLSLGVLVNLCYKNLPAIYTLLGHVDIKRLMNVCMTMEGSIKEVHTCKLLVILDYMNDDLPNNVLMKLIYTTFKSVLDSFHTRDSIVLRQIVDFFVDVGHKYSIEKLASYEYYDEHLRDLFEVIDCNDAMEIGENDLDNCKNIIKDNEDNNKDPECIGSVFKFLHLLIELELGTITKYYSTLIEIALKWIQNNSTSSEALNILTTIAVKINNNCGDDNEILEPLILGLPIFLTILNGGNEEISTNTEYNKKISGILQLLKAMLHSSKTRPKVIEEVKQGFFYKIFTPLTNNETSRRALTIDEINLYIYAIALINEFAKYNINWMTLQNNLMNQKQLQMVLAQALCTSSKEVKTIVFEIATTTSFPRQIVAEAMSSLLSTFMLDVPAKKSTTQLENELSFPVLSMAQIERLDDLLVKLRDSNNPSLSDVMELYEYRLASMGHSERITTASLEAATDRCTQLQHRIAHLTAELNRFHQLLFHTQQCHEKTVKSKDVLLDNIKQLTNQVNVEKGKLKASQSQLKHQETEAAKKLNEIIEIKDQFEEQNTKLKQAVHKLEENSTRLEKVVQKKEEIIKKANYNVENLNLEINELKTNLKQRETELQATKNELKNITKELMARKQILDTITKVASSQF